MMTDTTLTSHQFPAMGSTIEILLVGGTDRVVAKAIADAQHLAETWESVFSRFRSDSELSRLNASTDSAVRVSPLLFRGVTAALRARQQTDGLFDPTVLPALLRLGYDRSFERIREAGANTDNHLTVGPPAEVATAIQVNSATQTVTRQPGEMLDLGGIAKGIFVDELVSRLYAWQGGVVSAGGDLRIWGTPSDADAWIIGIEDPLFPERDIATVQIQSGAIATSGRSRRVWQHDGQQVHHLIDPRTAQSARNSLGTVTVIADTAANAEVAATALFIAGVDEPLPPNLRATFVTEIAVHEAGDVQIIQGDMKESSYGTRIYAA